MRIKFRKFKKSDSEAVARLIKRLYRDDPGEKTMVQKKIYNTFDLFSEHPDFGEIMVFEHENKLVGYAILINYLSNEYGGIVTVIDELFVQKKSRGKGIGTNFINYLVQSKFGNSVAIQLEVSPHNNRARALYERLGFKLSPNHTFNLELKKSCG